jgi:hypothetical protein
MVGSNGLPWQLGFSQNQLAYQWHPAVVQLTESACDEQDTVHGFGVQVIPLCHVPAQFACVVNVQFPEESQHAPFVGGGVV